MKCKFIVKIFYSKVKHTKHEHAFIFVFIFKISILSKHEIEKWIICTSILPTLTFYHLFLNEFQNNLFLPFLNK